MPIRIALRHETRYRYDRWVSLSPQIVRLRPAPHCRTPVTAYSLEISPSTHFLNWQQDPQGNFLARVVLPEKTRHFSVIVDLVAELTVQNPFDFFLEPEAERFPFAYESWLATDLAPFLEVHPAGPRLQALVESIDVRAASGGQPTVTFLVDVNQRLAREIRYVIRMDPGVQSCEETLERAEGSCRDTAWLLVQLVRRLGLAARFVSGYLIQLEPDVRPLEGPAGPRSDFTDLHAWAEVYLPGAGWIGLDPTSGLLAGEGHIPLATGREPLAAAPITGNVDECEVEFDVTMSVSRLHEDPRVTKPYTEAQWQRVDALGRRIDADLERDDVRLTFGGEPTFVSVDDMDGAEWTTAATGIAKRRLAEGLLWRLRDRFAPGAVLHHGQGKWYPGEPLPRWALTCCWRHDGVPMWRDPALLADPRTPSARSHEDALRFLDALARRLDVDPEYVLPAYEDPWHQIRAEGELPVNVDPADSRLEDPLERERLRRVFEHGLTTPVGFVLPLERSSGRQGPRWQSGMWMLRARHLLLVPGDSPLGLRLPLSRLPWVAAAESPVMATLDPMAPRPALPPGVQPHVPVGPSAGRRAQPLRHQQGGTSPDRVPLPGESAPWVVRTALCVQPRDGHLHLFMPPVATVEDYLDLLAAVEDTARALAMPVILEGYEPPEDCRLRRLKITPDPGVIEVNIHPAASWDELVENTTALYEDARHARLATEKFMLDGRHSGTGGGNHIVVGGPTPADSPVLRRPDLLRSLLGYWLNHPSLSYLFSGLFIGPTSQAPRIDEARHDSVYELEIAFRQIPEPGAGPCPPWLVDRVFRHLLTDVTGNTHRAEFCIDKLYAPESASGRLGLLELRAFEMPPHARMSLTQQLLLRALIAWFWRQPYRAAPRHWGTQLHDRFLLPHFVRQDFHDVLHELDAAGYPIEPGWFEPHFEFRFPLLGRVAHDGVELELRQAIEPWHVLGEEPGTTTTVRYVDSSVERLEVKARHLRDAHVVTCNGRRLPLAATGTHGEAVAGVRFRAWQPPACLHPTIPVHAPLVFDVLDGRAGRSLGGCVYHVGHPGGRNYETFPVNANEAESRRAARFSAIGHTAGRVETPPHEENPLFPTTLDLRRTAVA
jgi:uncharacterized protein (DUF2126 family)